MAFETQIAVGVDSSGAVEGGRRVRSEMDRVGRGAKDMERRTTRSLSKMTRETNKFASSMTRAGRAMTLGIAGS